MGASAPRAAARLRDVAAAALAAREHARPSDRMLLVFLSSLAGVVSALLALEPRLPARAASANAAEMQRERGRPGPQRAGTAVGDASDAGAAVELAEAVARDLEAFHATFQQAHELIFRMAYTRRMYEQLAAMVKIVESAAAAAGFKSPPEGEVSWLEQLAKARAEEEAELSSIAKRSTMPFVRNVNGHEAMEALTIMKFEIDFYPPPDNSAVHVASMRSVFFSIVRSSNGRVSKIPDWYSPPYLVVFEEPDPLGKSELGVSVRGHWIDRHHKSEVKNVVVKRMPLEADGIDTFRSEVETWFAMDSPYVIKLLSASHCSSPTMLILEDASNSTLREYVRHSNHQSELWAKVHDIARGLQYLSKRDVVHGNVKPSNLLVGKDGIAKVSDFGGGMATLQSRTLGFSETKCMWRAPEYRLPKKRPTYQGDVFSLGLCIVDALVDDYPFPSRDELAAGRGLKRIEGLSNAAWQLITKMTAFKAEDRITLVEVMNILAELEKEPTKHLVQKQMADTRRARSRSHGEQHKEKKRHMFRNIFGFMKRKSTSSS